MHAPNMTNPTRRSGRSRKVNTKYANAGWSKETLRLLRESSESSDPTSADSDEPIEGKDGEFPAQTDQAPSLQAASEEDDELPGSGSRASSAVDTPGEEDEDSDIEAEVVEGRTRRSKSKQMNAKSLAAGVRSRGIEPVERFKSVRGGVWQLMFGDGVEDLKPMVQAKDRWLFRARDITLPSWATMREAKSREWNEEDETHGDNIVSEISSELRSQQQLKQISFDDAKRRLFYVEGDSHYIALGPWTKQKAYNLHFATPFRLTQAWQVDSNNPDLAYHSGWLLNVREKPQCMAWAKYQTQAQFLALSHRATPEQRESILKMDKTKSPAFAPMSYPSNIQIWQFEKITGTANTSSMDYHNPPRLLMILACSFGETKQMEWAPEPNTTSRENYLGILTFISSDGRIRLVNIPQPQSELSEPLCFELVSAFITISPPEDVVFTCFSFASSTDIVVGCSSGHIQVYNICEQQLAGQKCKPYLSIQAHNTYIMSLRTVGHDRYSHFVASTSASGAIQLTDLRCPSQDTLTLPRARLPIRSLVYNPHTRAFLTTIDSSGNTEPRGSSRTTMVAHTLRHFYHATTSARFPEGSGIATVLAGSSLHPCVLAGNSSGAVWAQNVVRKILPTAKPGVHTDNSGAWIQKVVEYEWFPQPRPPPSTTTDSTESNPTDKFDIFNGPPTRPGMSRLQQGFRPERVDLSKTDKKRKGDSQSDASYLVVFDEEQAVTAIEWNENIDAAGWCAIGWGSGVILITDLGHDTI